MGSIKDYLMEDYHKQEIMDISFESEPENLDQKGKVNT